MLNYSEYIIEKSKLSKIGVPKEAMQMIEYDYAIDKNAEWQRIKKISEFIREISKHEKALYIQISYHRIKIIINYFEKYYIQNFKYDDTGFGQYIKEEQQNLSKTQLIKIVDTSDLFYKLKSDKFEYKSNKERKLQKHLYSVFSTTKDFKYNIIKKFNKIVKRLYNKRYDYVINKIKNNIKNLNYDISADELLNFLKDNKKTAELAKEYEYAKKSDDILNLEKIEKQFNSLKVIDEYLINFEELYSKKFNYHLTIYDLIEDFSLIQVENAFIYYLFTGKIKNLKI